MLKMKELTISKKTSIAMIAVVLVSTFVVGAGCKKGEHGKEEHAHKGAHWTYPDKAWGEAEVENNVCSLGKAQSPIDLPASKAAGLNKDDLTFSYKVASGAKIKNNGHTVQVDLPEGSSVTIGGVTYKLLQFHFHNPSEHISEGKGHAMEAHFVHADANGDLAVVGVFMDGGAENEFLNKTLGWSKLPKSGESADVAAVDVLAFLPKLAKNQTSYFSYQGSLTTPPCTEVKAKNPVKWNVLATPVSVSEAQAKSYWDIFGTNTNRSVQPLHGRTVILH